MSSKTIDGKKVQKNRNGWIVDGCTAYLSADKSSLKAGSGNVLLTAPAEFAEMIAEQEADYSAMQAAKSAPVAKKSYTSRTWGNAAKGFDGRGNRVADGAEWSWK